jgi:hypothetical protein
MKTIEMMSPLLADEGRLEEDSVVEVPLLLEVPLLERLEEAAEEQGLAAAGYVRRLLRDILLHEPGRRTR